MISGDLDPFDLAKSAEVGKQVLRGDSFWQLAHVNFGFFIFLVHFIWETL